MTKKKILFIVNPISGVKSKKSIPTLIDTYLDLNLFDYEIIETSHAGHGTEITSDPKIELYDIVAAVGGDGTINEVLHGIGGKSPALAIIPMGSGNGLARHLGIPMNTVKAIKTLNAHKVVSLDTFELNENVFSCTAGVGFDAHISDVFSKSSTRGFWSYFKITKRELRKYKALKYHLEYDDGTYNASAFSITFANSNQFGNNAKICPTASINDGTLDVVVIKPFPKIAIVGLFFRLFLGNILKSRYVLHFKSTEIELKNIDELPIHIDGEPMSIKGNLKVKISKAKTNAIIPRGKNNI